MSILQSDVTSIVEPPFSHRFRLLQTGVNPDAEGLSLCRARKTGKTFSSHFWVRSTSATCVREGIKAIINGTVSRLGNEYIVTFRNWCRPKRSSPR